MILCCVIKLYWASFYMWVESDVWVPGSEGMSDSCGKSSVWTRSLPWNQQVYPGFLQVSARLEQTHTPIPTPTPTAYLPMTFYDIKSDKSLSFLFEARHRFQTACENERLKLACKNNTVLAIYSASFGHLEHDTPVCPQGAREKPDMGLGLNSNSVVPSSEQMS